MTEYDSLIFDKDIAQAYREALDEVNGLDASKLALGEIEIMMARLLLFVYAIGKQAKRNRQRQRNGAVNVQQAGVQAQQAAAQPATPNLQQQNQITAAVNQVNKNGNRKRDRV